MTEKMIKDYIEYKWKVKSVEVIPPVLSDVINIRIKLVGGFNVGVNVHADWPFFEVKNSIDAAIKDHAWKAFEKDEVIPKIYPVCDCGEVLKGLVIDYSNEEIYEIHGMPTKIRTRDKITPWCCPKCGKRISAVAMKNWDPDNRLEFSYDF